MHLFTVQWNQGFSSLLPGMNLLYFFGLPLHIWEHKKLLQLKLFYYKQYILHFVSNVLP